MKIVLDIKKSVEENAAAYFETAKKARRKIIGVERTLGEFKKKQESAEEIDTSAESKIKKLSSEKKYWFEKFKWFISSEGFLVVGGRDATTNEIVIKKHTLDDDFVFHTDMAGSPFVVAKVNTEDVARLLTIDSSETIGEKTLYEAACFTAIHSKSWKLGLGSVKVFWVKPDQVSKEANSGEYMAKGSFMIRGKTNYLDPVMDFVFGVAKEDVSKDGNRLLLSGPREAVSAYCDNIITIIQGKDKTSDVAKKIRAFFKDREELDVALDSIISALPSGGCQIKKERKRKEDLKKK